MLRNQRTLQPAEMYPRRKDIRCLRADHYIYEDTETMRRIRTFISMGATMIYICAAQLPHDQHDQEAPVLTNGRLQTARKCVRLVSGYGANSISDVVVIACEDTKHLMRRIKETFATTMTNFALFFV